MSTNSSGARPVNRSVVDGNPEDYASLIEAVGLRQDRAAFATLFTTLAPKVKAYMIRKGVTPDLAEDLAIETFVKVWAKAATFDAARGSAAAWIFSICRNAHIDVVRQERRVPNLIQQLGAAAGPATPEDEYLDAEREERARLALGQLQERQASLVKMSFLEERPHGEIAKELSLPLGTVKSRLRTALHRLRTILHNG